MTTYTITLSQLIGHTPIKLNHIEVYPVWKENKIEVFDMFDKTTGEWLGSKRLLRYCEEFDKQCKTI